MRRFYHLSVISILLVGCTQPAPPDAEQSRAAVAEQLKSIEAATNLGLPPDEMNARYLGYFSDDAAVLPYGGTPIEGKDAILDFYTAVFTGGTLLSNVYTEPTIRVTDDFIVRTYRGTAEFTPAGSTDVVRYSNIYTDILVNVGGAWLIDWHSWVPAPLD